MHKGGLKPHSPIHPITWAEPGRTPSAAAMPQWFVVPPVGCWRGKLATQIVVSAIIRNIASTCYTRTHTVVLVLIWGSLPLNVQPHWPLPRKYETLTLGLFNVGPSCATLVQHWTNLGWTSRVCWLCAIKIHFSVWQWCGGRHIYCAALSWVISAILNNG